MTAGPGPGAGAASTAGDADALRRENEALRARFAALGEASLRIGASLDLRTVLQEVADSARALTDARAAFIATMDETRAPEDFFASGVSEELHQSLREWPDGPKVFEHVRDLDGPLRIEDFSTFLRSLGFSADLMPAKAVLGIPMRHRGVHVGNFYLVEKAGGGAFTGEDEETLVPLASQAAAAIGNARTYRAELQARADLEALVETSPVGVLVFDAATGRPVSINGEARRILEGLRLPGRPLEELMGVVTCRFAERREVALQDCPITRALSLAETMRNEELALSVPDGRSVRTLTNVTPIPAGDGKAGSVVVTLQDLAPLEELDRQRSEFIGMVSHELRSPLAAIKGSAGAVLDAARPFAPAETREFFRIIAEQADGMFSLIADLLDAGRLDAGTLTVSPEPTEVALLVDRARNTFVSGGGRHAILIDLPADLPRAMADRQRIEQVLNNLLANAARHSPESTPVRVEARRDGVHVAVTVADEGRGITPERLAQLFRRHGGTAGGAGTDAYGLGLAICKGLVEAHGGRIRAESAGVGQGARFTFTLPLAGDTPAATSAPERPVPDRAGEIILAVDDDPHTLRHVRDALAEVGYSPVVTGEHREIGEIIRVEKPALVLLDLVLPGTDGIELMQTVPALADLPVIFISAYGRDETVARALEAGAADYIVKPFSPTELVARIRAVLRRNAAPEPFVLGDLAIDYDRRLVTVAGRTVELTATEYELLRVLSLGAGRVVTYETLLDRVWNDRGNGDRKVLLAFVKQLRAKLGDDAASPTWIFNLRGVGYRMPRPGEEPAP